MKECLIIGGGIDALITAFHIMNNNKNIDLKIITTNSNPRDKTMHTPHGATWSSLSPRHVTHLEGYNRNLYQLNNVALTKKVSEGGWLGKNSFSQAEQAWLERRLAAQSFVKFNSTLFEFYKNYNTSAIKKWHELIHSYKQLFHNTNVNYEIDKIHAYQKHTHTENRDFSLSIHKLAINIIDRLIDLGATIEFNTTANWSTIQGIKNVIIAVGAYGHDLLKHTSLSNRVFAVAGCWLKGRIQNKNINFQVRHHDLWQQNYSHTGNNQYIIGSGYAITGFNTTSLCEMEKGALITRSIKLAEQFCDNIQPLNKICFRAFTDNDIPLINVESTNSTKQKIIVIGGMNTGTTTAAPLTGHIVNNILNNISDPWLNKLQQLNTDWTRLITHHYNLNLCNTDE